MTERELVPQTKPPKTHGRIRPSRFVAGIALHLAVPAYLLWLAVAAFPALTAPVLDTNRLAAVIGRSSLAFLVVYTVVLVALTLATRAIEPALSAARRRRAARDPEALASASAARVAAALTQAAGLGDSAALAAALERVRSAPWQHGDQRFQTLSLDLMRTASAFAGSAAGSGGSEQAELRELAARTFDRLALAAEQLANEQRKLDHGDARTVARYVELKYGNSDFASGAND